MAPFTQGRFSVRYFEGSPHLPWQFVGKNDFGFEILLWKILGIEGNHKICLARFGAEAKRVVVGVGGHLSRGMYLHLFGPLADQVDDSPDEIWTNAEALQNFLVFFQNIFRYEPHEIVPLAPPVEYIGTRIPAGNKRLSSLIHTCELSAANPFDYLTQLQQHADELVRNPSQWMPWNYQAALETTGARLDSG